MSKTLIQIDGGGFANKGSELMLLSVLDKVKTFDRPYGLIFHSRHEDDGPKAAQLGMYQLLTYRRFRIPFYKLIPKQVLEPYGIKKYDQADHVLDIGGYQIGDHWSKRQYYIDRVCSVYNSVHKKGGKVIFLPQAFGPFEKPESKSHLLAIYPYVDKVYARDKYSYSHLKNVVGGNDEKIEIMPDFTPLIQTKPLAGEHTDSTQEETVGIVPNFKMIQSKTFEEERAYIEYLSQITEGIIGLGLSVALINHEGYRDRDLIDKVRKRVKGHVKVVDGLNAQELKQVISRLKFLYSDRYHAAVSGLSSCVPTITTGWSHKYKALYEDFDFQEGMKETKPDDITQTLDTWRNRNTYENILSKLEKATARIQEKNEKMWVDIRQMLNM